MRHFTIPGRVSARLIPLAFITLFFNLSVFPLHGQNFYSYGGTVPNNSVGTCFTQTVSGVGLMTAGNALVRVCMSITQARPADLDIFLRCPDGTTIALSTDNGGTSGNDYYEGLCFSDCGPSGPITSGSDFRGVYTAEMSLAVFNSGTHSADGNWQLCIDDDNLSGTFSTLNYWSLDFGSATHPVTPSAGTCATAYPLTLPFSHTCMTLAGQPNTYSACTGAMDGADYLFSYTPASADEFLSIDIAQDFSAPSGFPTVTLLDVCPNLAMPANCIQSEIQFSSTENILHITSQPLTPGTTYYIVVSSSSGTGGVFDIRIAQGKNGNDDCLQATVINETKEYAGNNYAAAIPNLQAPSTAEMTCNGSIDNFVFYTFTTDATGSTVYVNVTDIDCDLSCGGACGIQLALFRRPAGGPCLGPGTWGAPVFCETSTEVNVYYAWSGLLPNTQYYLMVDGNAGSQCVWNLRVLGNFVQLLPADIVEFTVKAEGEFNKIFWKAAAEENLSHYEVEHAVVIPAFETVGSVSAQGSSTGNMNYGYLDDHTAPGMHYYRLKMYDHNGNFTYSEIQSIRIEEKEEIFALLPNPAEEYLQIRLLSGEEETTEVLILSLDGRQLLKAEIAAGQNEVMLNLQDLPAGIYSAQVISREGRRSVKKFTHL